MTPISLNPRPSFLGPSLKPPVLIGEVAEDSATEIRVLSRCKDVDNFAKPSGVLIIQWDSLVEGFDTHGKWQRFRLKTMAALTSPFMQGPFLGSAAIGPHWAVSQTTQAQYAMERFGQFLENVGVDLKDAGRDRIETIIENARESLLTLDRTEPCPRLDLTITRPGGRNLASRPVASP